MGMLDSVAGMFGINLGVDIPTWFGEDRPDEVRARNEQTQREFAQNAIQWRVADAKKAGLHPLFALGGGGASFSPNPVTVSDSQISVDPSRAVSDRYAVQRGGTEARDNPDPGGFQERAAQDAHTRTQSQVLVDEAQASLLHSQKQLVDQQIVDSVGARAAQAGVANKDRAVLAPIPTKPIDIEDQVEIKPRQVMPGPIGEPIAVGPPAPAFEPVWLAPGIPALVPAGSPQNLGDMEMSGWLVSAAATLTWWGEQAYRELQKQARKFGYYITDEAVQKRMDQLHSNSLDNFTSP